MSQTDWAPKEAATFCRFEASCHQPPIYYSCLLQIQTFYTSDEENLLWHRLNLDWGNAIEGLIRFATNLWYISHGIVVTPSFQRIEDFRLGIHGLRLISRVEHILLPIWSIDEPATVIYALESIY